MVDEHFFETNIARAAMNNFYYQADLPPIGKIEQPDHYFDAMGFVLHTEANLEIFSRS